MTRDQSRSTVTAALIALVLGSLPHAALAQGVRPDRQLLPQFDRDHDGRLNAVERQAAYEASRFSVGAGRGGNRNWGPADPGAPVKPADVKVYPETVPLYDAGTLRTLFFEFEDKDWEAKMEAFYRSDVDIPAKVTVDGKVYKDVGVHFRGNSSFSSVPTGFKRSLDVNFDYVDPKQKLYGHKTLNLLNANEDPTFLRGVLALMVARDYFMAPQANLMHVVINGEDWGIYENIEQFNDEMTKAWYKADKNDGKDARWKVPGSAGGGRGGLVYLGESLAAYRATYEMKSKEDPAQWTALMTMIRTLYSTTPDKLEAALVGKLDVDGVLKYLAWDNVLVSGDGFWTKGGDYAIYRDPKGVFHLLPHDVNEFFLASAGRGGTVYLDPLVGDGSAGLLGEILAVPAFRAKYLGYVREISTKWLDWKKLGPIVQQYNTLIRDVVYRDTKKLFFNEEFSAGVSDVRGLYGSRISLRTFADTRREYLDPTARN